MRCLWAWEGVDLFRNTNRQPWPDGGRHQLQQTARPDLASQQASTIESLGCENRQDILFPSVAFFKSGSVGRQRLSRIRHMISRCSGRRPKTPGPCEADAFPLAPPTRGPVGMLGTISRSRLTRFDFVNFFGQRHCCAFNARNGLSWACQSANLGSEDDGIVARGKKGGSPRIDDGAGREGRGI